MSNKHISYHILVDDLSEYELNLIIMHLIKIKPDFITVKGGERFDRAIWFVEQMYNRLPETKIILRKWPDDGILKRFGYDTKLWFNTIINPYLQWLKHYTNVIWLLDNESAEQDLTQYANATAQAMEMCGKLGIALAVGRFAAGNPREDQYIQLDVMWQGLKKWFNIHIWSPNEYFDKPNTASGQGSIFRYYNGWKRCKEKYNFIPKTVIGEFGLAVNYLSDKGFRSIGLDEREYFIICNRYFRVYYAPYNVPVCLFSVGNWNGFEISDTFFIQNENNPVEVNMIEKPYIRDIRETPVYAVATENGIRVRASAVTGRILGYVQKHDTLRVLDNFQDIGVNNHWLKIEFGNQIAYVAAWYFVRSSCANNDLKIQISEENMSPVVSAILEVLKGIVSNKMLMIPLLVSVITWIAKTSPEFSQEWADRIYMIILLILGLDGAQSVTHAAKGKTYNKQTKSWE